MNKTLVKYEPTLLAISSRNFHKDRHHKNPVEPEGILWGMEANLVRFPMGESKL